MAGSNAVQFRTVVKKLADGTVVDYRLQFRTKDVTSSILGLIPLSSNWSDWQDVETDVVEVVVT